MNDVSFYAVPDLIMQQKNPDIIYSPSLIAMNVEFEFNIPYGNLWLKTRSNQFSIARYAFLYILQKKLGLEPAIIRLVYPAKHDNCYQARLVVQNILDTKTPRHHYIKIKKLIDKIKQWDLTEITTQVELVCAQIAKEQAYRRTLLNHFIQRAQSMKQLNANDVMEQAELSEQ